MLFIQPIAERGLHLNQPAYPHSNMSIPQCNQYDSSFKGAMILLYPLLVAMVIQSHIKFHAVTVLQRERL